jgi:hypothetical protein
MLQDRGPVEEKIKELWTMKSIWEARFLLWAAYSVTLSLLLAVACVGVYQFAGCNLG